ncbi:type III restriction enzyme [Ligilactobacillus equi DPC 6820]|uniref:Type III restriction enzyme n=2 Tax=Ligilactobacillus equi TaxID=137357 RepID=V7HYQ7_9LACO|nr:type III restriction enzyme [Ligilactobacillus equi DPC 6820]
MARTKEKNELKFKNYDKLKELDATAFFNNQFDWEVPDYITDNLKHKLRNYQKEAIRYFNYTQTNDVFRFDHLKQLMFNMATGSGKTDLMAALILYLYQEKGYHNFIFTVNSKSVIDKTIDNLTNVSSPKYLFTPNISIDGRSININKIEGMFPQEPNKSDINIKFATIHTLYNELTTRAENTMALDDYAKIKVVVLADEAHHYSASTKAKSKLSKDDKNLISWETALNELNEINEDNLMLEFTATLDFNNTAIYNKYQDKVIYRYTLDNYIQDRYSKNIRRIQTANSNEDNMLSTVLLSEYRRIYALETFNLEIKPVILFKAHRIEASHEANQLFNELIKNLTSKSLKDFLKRQSNKITDRSSQTLISTFQYFLSLDSLDNVVKEIKRRFSPERIINANDDDNSKKKTKTSFLESGEYRALNSLESPSNLYRVIFAVAKLTEGWDVLNLFDIVRINNLGNTKDKKDIAATNSEAQLIGRGARYYPLGISENSPYQRIFDKSVKYELASLLLETLHYHTLNEPEYLNNLMQSLDEMNLLSGSDKKSLPEQVTLKNEFKKSKIYREGKIYYNEVEEIPDSSYTNIRTYGVDLDSLSIIDVFDNSTEAKYNDKDSVKDISFTTIPLEGVDIRYFKKAINRLDFYHFDNLKKYLPNIKSVSELWDENWLNLEHLQLRVKTDNENLVSDFSPDDKLKIVEQFLSRVSKQIKFGFRRSRGTNRFKGYPISEYVVDFEKRIISYDTHVAPSMQQKITNTLYPSHIFAYENAIVNNNEQNLIDAIIRYADTMEKMYGEVFLIRIDESMLRGTKLSEDLKLHQFNKNAKVLNLQGFQPDFILLLQNKDYYVQIFIEPKGEKLVVKDKWKEELLSYISEHPEKIEFEEEAGNVIIKGLKFYNTETENQVMDELKDIVTEYSDEEYKQEDGNIKITLF